VENKIGKEEWRNHFMKLLDGAEEEFGTEVTEIGEEEKTEETIEEEEIKKAMKKIKMKKAAGIDGIPMEAWRFAGRVVDGFSEINKRHLEERNIAKGLEEKRSSTALQKRG